MPKCTENISQEGLNKIKYLDSWGTATQGVYCKNNKCLDDQLLQTDEIAYKYHMYLKYVNQMYALEWLDQQI